MKRIAGLMLCLAALLSAARAEAWGSIVDICAQTPDRWKQTYETPWRVVTMDAAIEVPQVESFPILKVRGMPAVAASLLPADADVRRHGTGILQYYLGDAEQVVTGSTMYRSMDRYPGPELPSVVAEACSFMPKDTLELAQRELLRLYGMDANHFRLDETIVYSRLWRFKGNRSALEFVKPVTEEGSYKVRLAQLLHGIPYFSCSETGDGYEWHGWLNEPDVTVTQRGADSYMFKAVLWQVEEIVAEDVPLLPFGEAKAALEAEIMAGRLRSVEKLALGYAPYIDPEDPELFWLLPVWYAKGGYSEDPEREFTPWMEEDGSIADDGIERREVVFEAQRGLLMDRMAAAKPRYVIPFVEWEDLQDP